jgi:hypothetical protein
MLLFVGLCTKKSFFTFVVLLVIISSIFSTQIAHTADSYTHPRLYFNQNDLVNLRALRTTPSHQAIWNNIKSWADAHISDSPAGEPTGQSWRTWFDTAADIRIHLETMGFMYAMTDDPAYADAAKDWMLSIKNWSAWGTGASKSIAQCSSRIILGFCFGYDVLYDYLTSSERDAIRQAIITHTDFIAQLGYMEDYPNHTAIRSGAIGIAALTLGDEYDGASSWLSYAIDGAQLFLSYGGRDGGWFEGLSYGPYSMDGLIPFLDALKRVEGQDLFAESDFLKNTALFYIYMTYNGNPLQLEDCNWFEGYNITETADELTFIYKLASEYNDGYAQEFANNYASQSSMKAFIWKGPNVSATPPTSLPLTKYFRDIGYVISRSGWEADDPVLSFKSGSSRGHAQPSQNEFNIYYKGLPITCGPGYATGEAVDNTWLHNCILVDGKGQGQEPGDFASLPTGTTGVIEQVDVHNPYYIYLLGDASAVYNGQSGNGDLDEWLRHIVFMQNPEYFVIFDDVVAPRDSQFTSTLNMSGQVWNNKPAISVSDNQVTLNQQGIQLKVIIAEPESFQYEIYPYTNTATGYLQNQIRIKNAVLAPTTNFLGAIFLDAAMPTTRISNANLLGVIVETSPEDIDLILFSADGNPVNEYVELGGSYKAADGGSYIFEDTGVRAQFDSYQVMRLETRTGTNQPPVLNSIGNKSDSEEGELLQSTISTADPDDSLTYSASNLSQGASSDPQTKTSSWTPDEAGIYPTVNFEASDSSLIDSEDIIIAVKRGEWWKWWQLGIWFGWP